MVVQPLDRLLLLGRRRPQPRRAWCSRSRTRRGASATGTCIDARHRDRRARHAQGDARVAVPPDGRRLPRVVDRRPATRCDLDISVVRGGDDRCSRRASRCGDGRSTGGTPLAVLRALSRCMPLRGVARDLSARRSRCSSPAFPCTVIRRDPRRRSPHEPATIRTRACDRRRSLLAHLRGGTLELVDPTGRSTLRRHATRPRRAPIDARVDVHDPAVYERVLRQGSVGLGESYADGWWDTDDLAGVLRLALRSLRPISDRRDAARTGSRPRSSTRSHGCAAPTSTATRATCARTTTSATSSSGACSTRRWRTRARSSTRPA